MSIFDSVRKAVVDVMGFSLDEIAPETHFYDDLDADSLDLSQILIALENQYNIDLPNEELTDVQTLQDLVDEINTRLEA